MTPRISIERIGIIAIRPIIPKLDPEVLPAKIDDAPIAKGKRNVEDIGPVATPPESKAIPTKSVGQNGVSARIKK